MELLRQVSHSLESVFKSNMISKLEKAGALLLEFLFE